MQIISLNNHIVRKALCLSLNEMAVLCDIKQMSQEQKFGYTCIKSKDKIADWLDLSRTTVFTIIDTLIKKGLIEKNEIGLKPTSFVYQLDMCQEDIGLWLKNGGVELVTKKIQDILSPCTDSTDSGLNSKTDSTVSVLGQYSFCTQVYNIDTQDNRDINNPPLSPNGENVGIDFKGLDKAVEAWLKYKAEKNQKYKSSSSIQTMVNKLWRFSKGNPEKAIEIVESSMAMNYTGFFEPKENGSAPAAKPSPPRKSKVKYYDTDFPDRVRVATREEYNLLVSGNPDSTFVITQEYFD
jgi:hypothetical protein